MRITRPRDDEPIRLVSTKTRPRYRAVISTGQHPDGRRRQETKTFDTLREARDWVSETRSAVKRGTHTSRDTLSFDGLCSRWLASKRDVREVTRSNYTNVLKPVRTRLGQRKAQDLRRSDMEALVEWLAADGGQRGKGLSRTSIVYTMGRVHQVLAYGVTEGLLPMNVSDGVKAPRKNHGDNREFIVWETGDLLRFRGVSDTDAWAAAWRLTLSGLRRSEVLGLKWSDLDLDRGIVAVNRGRVALDGKTTVVDDPKSSASRRSVPFEQMHPGTAELLRTLAKDRLRSLNAYPETDYVVVDALGQPVRPEAYSDRFATLCQEAHVPVVRLHSTRHALAGMLHRAGVAPADAAALLGHEVTTHLAFYVKPSDNGMASAATALGSVLSAVQ